jgi:hypothetical protein
LIVLVDRRSRQTLEGPVAKRHKQALAASGTPIKTRGDVAEIGPALLCRDCIVKLFLEGYPRR